MRYTTQGIVLNYIKYQDTSIIVKIFTAAFGLQSYIIRGVRTQKSKHSMAFFQPLTLLDMVVDYKKQRNLQRISEVHCHISNNDILINLKKATMAIFLAELLAKVVHEEANQKLFDFIWQAIIHLNTQMAHYESFHLTFMLQLVHYLGFGIRTVHDMYTQLKHAGKHGEIDQKTRTGLQILLANDVTKLSQIDNATRRSITTVILKFYQLHIASVHSLKSLRVLQAIY